MLDCGGCLDLDCIELLVFIAKVELSSSQTILPHVLIYQFGGFLHRFPSEVYSLPRSHDMEFLLI